MDNQARLGSQRRHRVDRDTVFSVRNAIVLPSGEKLGSWVSRTGIPTRESVAPRPPEGTAAGHRKRFQFGTAQCLHSGACRHILIRSKESGMPFLSVRPVWSNREPTAQEIEVTNKLYRIYQSTVTGSHQIGRQVNAVRNRLGGQPIGAFTGTTIDEALSPPCARRNCGAACLPHSRSHQPPRQAGLRPHGKKGRTCGLTGLPGTSRPQNRAAPISPVTSIVIRTAGIFILA